MSKPRQKRNGTTKDAGIVLEDQIVKGVFIMKAWIDREGCIGCSLCETTCPAVFRMAEDGLAEVYTDPVPVGETDAATEARDNCPVSVIHTEE